MWLSPQPAAVVRAIAPAGPLQRPSSFARFRYSSGSIWSETLCRRATLVLEQGSMGSFYISEDVRDEDLVLLHAGGEIDFEASPQLKQCLEDHVKAGRRRLVFDLSSARFLDSTAIGVLVGCSSVLRKDGGGLLAIVCPPENRKVLRILEITGIDSMVPVHHSLPEALSDLTTAR